MGTNVIFNESSGRYEMQESGAMVFARTHRKDDVLYIDHVEAAPELRGSGAAGRFMQGLMEIARAESLKVQPICGYAASWLKRHNEFRDLSPN